ncbi:MAG: hypothetical protein SVR94_18025, partial [Pseudomonadota bacterium]|nr:hypothetical protein [Pseudomonadota bacterium]
LGFTGAPYCNILISDEPSNGDDYSQTDAITAMQAHGGIFFGIVSSGTPTDSYDDIALATGGQMFDLAAFENDPTQALTAVLSACKAAVNVGYMTGGGSIIDEAGNRVRHGFELHCNINDLPNNLQVNWEHNQFHLETLTKVRCSDDPQLDEGKPVAGFDTYEGEGIGRLNGAEAEIKFTFTDAGEPGAKSGDKVTILIEADGHSVLSVTDKINQGNQQAHAGKE